LCGFAARGSKKEEGLLRRTEQNDGIEDVKKVVKQAKCAKTGMEAKVQCARGGGDQQRKRRRLNMVRPLPGQPVGTIISSPAQIMKDGDFAHPL
jgi:hypothetical protein